MFVYMIICLYLCVCLHVIIYLSLEQELMHVCSFPNIMPSEFVHMSNAYAQTLVPNGLMFIPSA